MPKQIPIRSQICAPKGFSLVQCDLSGAEAWVVAYLADDPNMKRELADGDLHSFTAAALFNISIDHSLPLYDEKFKKLRYAAISPEQRYPGKRTNHSSNYMQGPAGLMEAINGEGLMTISFAESRRFQEVWKSIYYNVPLWWGRVREQIWATSTIETVYGFKRTFYGQKDDSLIRVAVAQEPQSTVGDHCFGKEQKGVNEKGGLLEFHKRHKNHPEIEIVNTSHDSGMVLCPTVVDTEIAHELASLLRRPLMINGEIFTIPVDAEIGERFGELEKIKLAA